MAMRAAAGPVDGGCSGDADVLVVTGSGSPSGHRDVTGDGVRCSCSGNRVALCYFQPPHVNESLGTLK